MFKVGSIVQIKPNLSVGTRYFGKDGVSEVFTNDMKDLRGKEAKVVKVFLTGKYRIDISEHLFTDEMLQKPIDYLAISDYEFNPDVEELIHHVNKQFYKNQIDKALDDKMHEKNPEEFQKLIKLYNRYN